MNSQHAKNLLSGFIGRALAVVLCTTTLDFQCTEGSETNNLSNWSPGSRPREVGQLMVNYMVPRWQVMSPTDRNVQDFIWLVRYSKQTADEELRGRLIERRNPLLKQFEENRECLQRNVEESMFGALLSEICIQTGNPRYLSSGKMLADRQWKDPRDDGLSRESRFRVEDMYLITMLQVQAFRATADPLYLDRAALTLSAYLEKLQDSRGLFHHALEAPHCW